MELEYGSGSTSSPETYWQQRAQLYRWDGPAALIDPQWRRPPVLRGSLAEIVRALRAFAGRELWRYAVSNEERPLIVGAELGQLFRRDDLELVDRDAWQPDLFSAHREREIA